eukprot:c48357_g1_i1.p1 GENE.c48357_g1_i1~~c48357_g1_i1.p1  ORF type:complete len:444 (+),score=68.00 c48357_g1_i1:20-1351(+)
MLARAVTRSGAAALAALARAMATQARAVDDYSRFFSKVSAARKPSPIRALMPLLRVPGMISLGAGLPNASVFPFEDLTIKLKSGESMVLKGAVLNEALQYSASPGLPGLVAHLEALQARVHGPAAGAVPRALAVTSGSQDGLTKAFSMLLDDGDSLIVEDPTYAGALAYLEPLGVRFVKTPVDAHGLDVDALAARLRAWRVSTDGRKPKAIYTIPTGQNPSGATLSAVRRRALLALASEHDFLILEDDPYFFLSFDAAATPRSMQSQDTESRVLRFDSFSKVLSSGLRMGWVSGPAPLVEQLLLHTQSADMHSSGVSQAVVSALLGQWGAAGFDAHVASVRAFYAARARTFLGFADKHLKGLATWSPPTAGMFLWLKVNGVADTHAMITKKGIGAKVMLVPGSAFVPGGGASSHVRASFSVASESDMEAGCARFAQLIRDERA